MHNVDGVWVGPALGAGWGKICALKVTNRLSGNQWTGAEKHVVLHHVGAWHGEGLRKVSASEVSMNGPAARAPGGSAAVRSPHVR
jgi:hypothetical protein